MSVMMEHTIFTEEVHSDKKGMSPIRKSPDQTHLEETPLCWTSEEEAKIVRKVDFIVMPLLMLTYLAMQLDRANIGNALTDNFLQDVGITQDWFNVGQQLLAAALTIFEIPCNMALYRLGPNIWITGQVLVWAMVATFQMFQNGLGSYLAIRLLLGLLEAGFMPAGLYTLSLWYKTSELSRRYAFFFGGYIVGQAINGLVAYGILQMRGISGLAGWQWLFMLEGLFTILVGVAFGCLFPGSPNRPRSLIGLRYFSERESLILQQRVIADDSTKEPGKKSTISPHEVLSVLGTPRIWLHVLPALCGAIPFSALIVYAPTLIASFGFDPLRSNAMASVGQWMSLVSTLAAGTIADRTGRRGFIVLAGVIIKVTFAITFRSLPDDATPITKLAIITMCIVHFQWWNSVNVSWMSINCISSVERVVSLALYTMALNVSLVAGAQIFRSDDAPLYHRGWSIIVGVDFLSVTCISLLLFFYAMSNVRTRRDSWDGGSIELVNPSTRIDLSTPNSRKRKSARQSKLFKI